MSIVAGSNLFVVHFGQFDASPTINELGILLPPRNYRDEAP